MEVPEGGGWVDSGRQISLEKLTQSTHAHLLSFAVLFVRFWRLNMPNRDDILWMMQAAGLTPPEPHTELEPPPVQEQA